MGIARADAKRRGSKIGRSSPLTCIVSGAYWRIIVVYFVVVGQRGHLGGVLSVACGRAELAWFWFWGELGLGADAALIFELKRDALHSLTSLGWRLASHSIGHGLGDGATGWGPGGDGASAHKTCSLSCTALHHLALIHAERGGTRV